MFEKTAPSFNVDIHMAGDINAAGVTIQRYGLDVGLCVSLSPQSFIYSGGREEGFRVGFINYPRFPKDPGDVVARARDLASVLCQALGQHSYSIVSPVETIWCSSRAESSPVTAADPDLLAAIHGLLLSLVGEEFADDIPAVVAARAALAKAEGRS